MIPEIILLSTAYLPPVEYIVCITRAKKVIIEQYETFPKQTYRNRCLIYSANGLLSLSIPVIKPHGNSSKTHEIQIAHQENWIVKHWRAIESAYSNSPYFLYYKDELKHIFDTQYENLLQFNNALLKYLLEKLQIKTPFESSTDFIEIQNDCLDYRFSFSPKKEQRLFEFKPYYQVFSDKLGFIPNLSSIDLLFNQGPEAKSYINNL